MRHYFEGHPVTVVSQYNLRSPLENPLSTGRISWWSMELQGFGLKFEHTNNIKSQALADFMAEWTETEFDGPVEESSLPEKEDPNAWIMHFDGSFSRNKGGAGVVLESPTGDRLKYVVQVLYGENIMNNAMEYEGLLAGLRAAVGLGIDKIIVKGDSQLVIKQINKEYACPQMAPYVEEVSKLQRRFNSFRATYVPQNENTVADELS